MGTQIIQANEENVYIKSLKGELQLKKQRGLILNNVKVNNTYSIPPNLKLIYFFHFPIKKKKSVLQLPLKCNYLGLACLHGTSIIDYTYNVLSSQILFYSSTSNELVPSKENLNFYQKLLVSNADYLLIYTFKIFL